MVKYGDGTSHDLRISKKILTLCQNDNKRGETFRPWMTYITVTLRYHRTVIRAGD